MCNFLKIIKSFRKKKKISRESTYLRSSPKERSFLLDILSSSSSRILLTNGVPNEKHLNDLVYKRDYNNNPLLMEYLSESELLPPSVYLESCESDDSLYLNGGI
jgi:hypothetical protein